MNLRILLISLITIHHSFFLLAQSAPSELERRLIRTWKLSSIDQGENNSQADQATNDFVLIINSDHTVKQGMNPDGLISGRWSVKEKEMMLVINDDVMNQQYKMKIVLLTNDELILQDPSNNSQLKIHYHAK